LVGDSRYSWNHDLYAGKQRDKDVKDGICSTCKNKLPPRKTRFCSSTCSEFNDSIKRKEKTLRLSALLRPRKCIGCGSMFQPKTERHACCGKVCWDILAAERAKVRRIENRAANDGKVPKGAGNISRKIGRYGKPTATNIPRTFVATATFTRADTRERLELQSKVEEYLANGGKILKFGDQPAITNNDSISTWEVSDTEEDVAMEKYRLINAHDGN